MNNYLTVINNGHRQNKSMNDICKDLMSSGASYKEAGKIYKKISIEEGHLLNVHDKRKVSEKLFNELHQNSELKLDDWQDAIFLSNKLIDLNKSFNKFNAVRYLIRWCVSNRIELPEKPKKQKYLIGIGVNGQILTWMVNNIDANLEQLKEFIAEIKGESIDSSVVCKSANRYFLYYQFHHFLQNDK